MNNDFEALQDIIIEEKTPQQKIQDQDKSNNVLEILKKELESKINAYKTTIKSLEKELQEKNNIINSLNQKQEELLERIKNLQELLEQKTKENEELYNIKSSLEQQLEEYKNEDQKLKEEYNYMIKAIENINQTIKQRELLTLEEIEIIVKQIIDSLYAKCNVDIKKIIQKILEDVKILQNSITLKANKNFIEAFKKYSKDLNLIIDFIEDDAMQEGEFIIESKDFFIERINEDMLEDAIEKALQNIR